MGLGILDVFVPGVGTSSEGAKINEQAKDFLSEASPALTPGLGGGAGGIIGIGNKQETNITQVDSRQVSTTGDIGVSGAQISELITGIGGLTVASTAAQEATIPRGYSGGGGGTGEAIAGILTPTNLLIGAAVLAGLYLSGVFK